MQIEIDFEVFKALTALRASESDSYNAVIRRLLALPDPAIGPELARINALLQFPAPSAPTATSALADAQVSSAGRPETVNALSGLLGQYKFGMWLGNAHFPEGTRFRATYKGQTYFAEVRDGKWLGQDGVHRNSPSEAAGAITGNNVNGWRFWFVQTPNDPTWRRLDELKS